MGNVTAVAQAERSRKGSLESFPFLVFEEWIASYKLFKVARCVHKEYGLVVVKVFLQPTEAEAKKRIEKYIAEIRRLALLFRETSPLWLSPHVMPYDTIETNEESALLIRQHHLRSLYQRLYTRPYLRLYEKRWLAWQMLAGLCQLHAANVCHGDIKTDNVFVTSLGHVMLTDVAYPFKPTYVPRDDPAEVSFFFESGDYMSRGRCYLAPERFTDDKLLTEADPMVCKETCAMDVFSMGCTIAEMMLDGHGVIDLPGLHLFRSGKSEILDKQFAKIPDKGIVALLKSMTALDPDARPTAAEALKEWNRMCAPAFSSVLYPLSMALLHPLYRLPDFRLWLLQRNFSRLLQALGLPPYRVRDVDLVSQYDIISAAKATAPRVSKSMIASNSDWTPPLLDYSRRYADKLMEFWASQASNNMDGGNKDTMSPAEASAVIDELFTSKENWKPPARTEETMRDVDGTIEILVTIICVAFPQSSCPRLRTIAVEMLDFLAPHAPNMLEVYIVPFLFQTLSDRNINVVMSATKALCSALICLPPPQLPSPTNRLEASNVVDPSMISPRLRLELQDSTEFWSQGEEDLGGRLGGTHKREAADNIVSGAHLFVEHIFPQFHRLCGVIPLTLARQLPKLCTFADRWKDKSTGTNVMAHWIEKMVKHLMAHNMEEKEVRFILRS